MAALLDNLIDATDGGVVMGAQLQFKMGLQPIAGGLRRGPVTGIYEICFGVEPGKDASRDIRAHDVITVSQFFEADAVQYVLVQNDTDLSDLELPNAGKIITPGGAH